MENAFFKIDDIQAREIEGYPVNPGWWSRSYEYPWALQYAEGNFSAPAGRGLEASHGEHVARLVEMAVGKRERRQ